MPQYIRLPASDLHQPSQLHLFIVFVDCSITLCCYEFTQR